MVHQRSFVPYLVLLGGVLIAASSSILIRFAQGYGVPSIQIATGRVGLAALILLPIGLVRARQEVLALTRRELGLAIISGVLLAGHFASWITSLEYTSVASSVALVATNPLWVGLASLVLFRERLAPLMWLGMALTISGSVLIGISDSTSADARNALFGNGLALLGAITVSGYFLIGRQLREHISLLAYIWVVYTSAAIVLLLTSVGLSLNAGEGIPFLTLPWPVYLLLLGMAVGPQLLGHTSLNWALRYLSATFVTIGLLGEPLGSALLAWALFGETFAQLQLFGFVLLLVGIVFAARSESKPVAPTPQHDIAPSA
jgi:drug/metabolite transporter (DMT)-like permease